MANKLHVVAAVFVNCLLITPVPVKAKSQTLPFFNIKLDNFIFTSSLEFESKARSVSDCARQCNGNTRCVTYTYVTGSPSGSCRGHSAIFSSTSDHSVSVTRAKTFTRPECTTYTVLDDYRRHEGYTATSDLKDDGLEPGWYRFLLNGANAVIPTYCVWWWKCGTVGSLWLRLDNGVLPDVGGQQQGISFAGCDPEGWYTPVTVMNCGDFLVYLLNPTPLDSSQSYCVAIQT